MPGERVHLLRRGARCRCENRQHLVSDDVRSLRSGAAAAGQVRPRAAVVFRSVQEGCYEALRSGRSGAFSVKVVERVVVQEHDLSLASDRTLLDDLTWQPVMRAYEAIGDAIGFVRRGRRW